MNAAQRETRHERVRHERFMAARDGSRKAGLVVIGCSLGGLQVLETILRALPDSFQVPVAIAQHRHSSSTDALGQYLQRFTSLPVIDAEDQQPIEGGRIYLAPANYHLMVEGRTFRLSVDEAVYYSRPSIDVLFESAADAFGKRLIGIILTGANADGASGSRRISARGGMMIAQDPSEAEAPAMPAAAIAAGGVDRVLPIHEIASFLAGQVEMVAE
jgi:two-component system chemotaxis response regulator CheB